MDSVDKIFAKTVQGLVQGIEVSYCLTCVMHVIALPYIIVNLTQVWSLLLLY